MSRESGLDIVWGRLFTRVADSRQLSESVVISQPELTLILFGLGKRWCLSIQEAGHGTYQLAVNSPDVYLLCSHILSVGFYTDLLLRSWHDEGCLCPFD